VNQGRRKDQKFPGKVKVEGGMIVKRHRKAVPQMGVEGGIIEQEAWVEASNVALIDPETGKPTRIRTLANPNRRLPKR